MLGTTFNQSERKHSNNDEKQVEQKQHPDILVLEENTRGEDIVIGDVHGNAPLLEKLIKENLLANPDNRLFIVGDLVDRGVDSPGVVKLINDINEQRKKNGLPPQIYVTRGNHEEMYLAAREELRDQNNHSKEEYKNFLKNGGKWIQKPPKNVSKSAWENTLQQIENTFKNFPYIIHVKGKKPFNIVHADMPFNDEELQKRIQEGRGLTDREKEYATWAREEKSHVLIKQTGRNQQSTPTFCGHSIINPALKYKYNQRVKTNTIDLDVGAMAVDAFATVIINGHDDLPVCQPFFREDVSVNQQDDNFRKLASTIQKDVTLVYQQWWNKDIDYGKFAKPGKLHKKDLEDLVKGGSDAKDFKRRLVRAINLIGDRYLHKYWIQKNKYAAIELKNFKPKDIDYLALIKTLEEEREAIIKKNGKMGRLTTAIDKVLDAARAVAVRVYKLELTTLISQAQARVQEYDTGIRNKIKDQKKDQKDDIHPKEVHNLIVLKESLASAQAAVNDENVSSKELQRLHKDLAKKHDNFVLMGLLGTVFAIAEQDNDKDFCEKLTNLVEQTEKMLTQCDEQLQQAHADTTARRYLGELKQYMKEAKDLKNSNTTSELKASYDKLIKKRKTILADISPIEPPEKQKREKLFEHIADCLPRLSQLSEEQHNKLRDQAHVWLLGRGDDVYATKPYKLAINALLHVMKDIPQLKVILNEALTPFSEAENKVGLFAHDNAHKEQKDEKQIAEAQQVVHVKLVEN